MNAKHTKGPWHIYRNGPTAGTEQLKVGSIDENRRLGECVATGIESPANARLIAAAPELLEAAKQMIACLQFITTDDFSRGVDKRERERLEAAIAKSEGNCS